MFEYQLKSEKYSLLRSYEALRAPSGDSGRQVSNQHTIIILLNNNMMSNFSWYN